MDIKFGWKRDAPDPRDRKFKLTRELPLPRRVSLRGKMPPVRNQRDLGCCTGETVCGLVHYRELTDTNPRTVRPSVLFQYYNTRVLEGTVKEDAGASIRSAVKAAAQYGVCPDELWPFEPSRFAEKPPAAAYKRAAKLRALDYRRVDEGDPQLGYLLKSLLAAGNPVAFGFSCYASLENTHTLETGFVRVPLETERCLGGHAALLVGYDDDLQCFEFRNSWGVSWGAGGYGWLPYKYALDGDLAGDFWTVYAVPGD